MLFKNTIAHFDLFHVKLNVFFPFVFGNIRSSGRATTATTTKQTPGRTQNTPGNLVRVKNPTRTISGGPPLMEGRDYRSP